MKTIASTLGLCLLLSMASADFTTKACFTLNGGPIENAVVKCYDKNTYFSDDPVGPSEGVLTGSDGCAELEDTQLWLFEYPDIYCQIEPNGECFGKSTTEIKNDHYSSEDADLGTTELTYDKDYCGDDWQIIGNGCGAYNFPSWLRETLTEVSGFDSSCDVHDHCYTVCEKTRAECDDEFYDDMLQTCAGNFNCEVLAGVYYQAVDAGGASLWDEGCA